MNTKLVPASHLPFGEVIFLVNAAKECVTEQERKT